jgi:hypothetical protein
MNEDLDDITRAARMMADAEPPPDLEARIKRRLDADALDASPRWRPSYFYVAASVAAVVIAVLALPITQSRSPEVLDVPQSRSPDVPKSGAGPRDLGTSGPRNVGTSMPRDLGTSVPRVLDTSELQWLSRRIPALEPIAVLDVDHMVFESIQPEPHSIAPLTMMPLVTSPVLGDPDAERHE